MDTTSFANVNVFAQFQMFLSLYYHGIYFYFSILKFAFG